MACCVTPASAELRSGLWCSAAFGPGTKPKIARLGLSYPRAFNICLWRPSRMLISCSTIGFCRQTNRPHAADGASLPHGYCPCCFVLSVFSVLAFPNTLFASRLVKKNTTIQTPRWVKEETLLFSIFSLLNLCSRKYGWRFIRDLFCVTQLAFTPQKSPLDSSPLL